MVNVVKQTEMFVQFAEEKLESHLYELNSRYWNGNVDDEKKRTAYHTHRRVFEQELDEKIQMLLEDENNAWLKGDLANSKQAYLDRLIPGREE